MDRHDKIVELTAVMARLRRQGETNTGTSEAIKHRLWCLENNLPDPADQ